VPRPPHGNPHGNHAAHSQTIDKPTSRTFRISNIGTCTQTSTRKTRRPRWIKQHQERLRNFNLDTCAQTSKRKPSRQPCCALPRNRLTHAQNESVWLTQRNAPGPQNGNPHADHAAHSQTINKPSSQNNSEMFNFGTCAESSKWKPARSPCYALPDDW